MKKSLMVAAALAVLSIPGAASALNTDLRQELVIDGLGSSAPNRSLGTLRFMALGRNGPFCDYLGNWESRYNPNAVQICYIHEYWTSIDPSCNANERRQITTNLIAGPMTGTPCGGFNIKGEEFYDGVQLFLSSRRNDGLTGLVLFSNPFSMYPVTTVSGPCW